MIIKFEGKNQATKNEIMIETNYIPRVGEIVYFKGKFNDSKVSHLVLDVSYEIDSQSLTPVVICREADPIDRNIRLQENGWL